MVDLLPEDKSDLCWFVEPWQAQVDIALQGSQYSKSPYLTDYNI